MSDKLTITAAPKFTHAIQLSGSDGRALLKINSDGTVEGEIEDASEAARRFVEYVRLMMAPPKTVTFTVVSAADGNPMHTFKIDPTKKTILRPLHSMIGYVFEPEGIHADD